MQINSRLLYNALQKQAAQAAEQSFTTGTDRSIGFALGLQKAASIVFDLTHSVGLSVDVIRIYSELYVATDDLVGEYFEAANPPEVLTSLSGEIEGLLRALRDEEGRAPDLRYPFKRSSWCPSCGAAMLKEVEERDGR